MAKEEGLEEDGTCSRGGSPGPWLKYFLLVINGIFM
jgi:hypothetical protein